MCRRSGVYRYLYTCPAIACTHQQLASEQILACLPCPLPPTWYVVDTGGIVALGPVLHSTPSSSYYMYLSTRTRLVHTC